MKDDFSWLNTDDVQKRLKLSLEQVKGIITPSGSDQRSCDACWAFHLAQVMSDRIRIKLKDNTFPELSPMQLLAESGQGCSGGSFEEGIEILQKKGITTLCCHEYKPDENSIRATTQTCNPSYRGFTSMFPSEIDVNWKCNNDAQRYKMNKYSEYELSTKEMSQYYIRKAARRIMNEIYKNGPVVCRISIFEDFYSSYTQRGIGECNPFDETFGIYMNITGEESLYHSNIAFESGKCCNKCTSCNISGHGLAIVGWGRKKWIDVPQSAQRALFMMSKVGFLNERMKERITTEITKKYDGKYNKGLLRITKSDYVNILSKLNIDKTIQEKLIDSITNEQTINYWILRNSWGKGRTGKKCDSTYKNGIVHVAFCDTYIIDGQKRRVNLAFGIEYRFHCGAITKSITGDRITLCGGALNPGTPKGY
jgi:hypothetical protein